MVYSMKSPRLIFYGLFYSALLYGIMHASAVTAEIIPADSTENRLNLVFEKNTEIIDLTETLILISKDWNPSLDEKPLRSEIDQLVASVKNQLKPESTAQETVDILKRVIHQEKGYRYTDQVDERGIPVNKDELLVLPL